MELSQDVRSVIELLIRDGFWEGRIERRGELLLMTTEKFTAYRRTLVLQGETDAVIGEYNEYVIREDCLTRDEKGYSLRLGDVDPEADSVTIRFTRAQVEVEIYRADRGHTFDNPWEELRCLCSSILLKEDIPGGFNDAEMALLPLMKELRQLDPHQEQETSSTADFPLLTAFFKDFGCDLPAEPKARDKFLKRLVRLEYAPALQQLRQQIAATQEGYPEEVEVRCPAEILTNVRRRISRRMKALGYVGTYPHFTRTGPIRGIHLAESKNQSYFVYREKKADFHIHCYEECSEEGMLIQFVSGTVIPRKDVEPSDFYSCFFDGKGSRYVRTLTCWIPFDNRLDQAAAPLETYVDAAAKRAELRRLTKQERKLLNNLRFWPVFLSFLVIGGGMFSLLFNLGMLLLCCLITAIAAGPQEVPGMIAAIPWLQMIAFAWVGFGGAMGVITALAARK